MAWFETPEFIWDDLYSQWEKALGRQGVVSFSVSLLEVTIHEPIPFYDRWDWVPLSDEVHPRRLCRKGQTWYEANAPRPSQQTAELLSEACHDPEQFACVCLIACLEQLDRCSPIQWRGANRRALDGLYRCCRAKLWEQMDFFPWERAARYIFPAKFFSPQLLKTVSSLDGKTAVNLAIANIRYYLSAWQIVRYRFSPEAEEELRRKDRARVEKFAAFIHGASSEKADDGHSIQAASPTPSENLDSINLPPAKAITSRLSLLNSADPLQEGSRRLVIRDQIERNPAARRICLAHHGYRCAVCGIDLGKEFGEEFEGLIEVHHLTPLSESPEQHEVDPRADLIPLCPTCHRMAHWKTKTPRTAEDLRRIVQHER